MPAGARVTGKASSRRPGALCWLGALAALVTASSGCQSDGPVMSKMTSFNESVKEVFVKTPKAPPPPVDNFVMRGSGLEKDQQPVSGSVQAELEGAKTLYAQGKYADAEKIFHRLAHNSKNPTPLVEEALFLEGDCLYLEGKYPKAESTFKKLLQEFQLHSRFHNQATQRLFDIANYWLDDTRKIMKEYEEKREGKRWLVMPVSYVNVAKEKPLLDIEGRAMEALEQVHLSDINGPLGQKALFYIATVKFFREDYKDADFHYRQIYENPARNSNDKLVSEALKYSIICKQMMTGGSPYDSRVLQEAYKLIIEQAKSYPELRGKDDKFLERQLVNISHQQADKDYTIAEFYRRTGHPGSAYFYYELVRRRYPGTSYSKDAEKRMEEMRGRLEKEQRKNGNSAEAPANPTEPVQPPALLGPEPRLLPPGLSPGRNP